MHGASFIPPFKSSWGEFGASIALGVRGFLKIGELASIYIFLGEEEGEACHFGCWRRFASLFIILKEKAAYVPIGSRGCYHQKQKAVLTN